MGSIVEPLGFVLGCMLARCIDKRALDNAKPPKPSCVGKGRNPLPNAPYFYRLVLLRCEGSRGTGGQKPSYQTSVSAAWQEGERDKGRRGSRAEENNGDKVVGSREQ
jgi:hypothetical protein